MVAGMDVGAGVGEDAADLVERLSLSVAVILTRTEAAPVLTATPVETARLVLVVTQVVIASTSVVTAAATQLPTHALTQTPTATIATVTARATFTPTMVTIVT